LVLRAGAPTAERRRDFLPKPALLLSPGAFLTGTMRQPSSGIRRLVAQAIRENSLVEQWDIPALHAE